jgi:predicted SAM-dependent methyltransferase
MLIKSTTKEGLPVGLQRAQRKLRDEMIIAAKHRSGLRRTKDFSSARPLHLNIGCGPNLKQGWVNIDIAGPADLYLDLREPIPFNLGSVRTIYSEHFFEHLDYPRDALHFLSECFRILELGGLFSVGVPDTEWPLRNYCGQATGWLEAAAEHKWHPHWCRTPLEHINYLFRQDGDHKFAWDFETLRQALEQTGFKEITRRDFDPARDDVSRAIGTLYVDAVKA